MKNQTVRGWISPYIAAVILIVTLLFPLACSQPGPKETRIASNHLSQPDLSSVVLSQDAKPLHLSDATLLRKIPPPKKPSPLSSASPISAISVILTTRPSFTDTWLNVPRGSFQAESGATYADNQNRAISWVLPKTLLKYGLTRNTEFRAILPSYLQGHNQEKNVNNWGDIALGFSHHNRLPGKIDLAVIPLINIPTGANNVSSNAVDPQLRLVLARPLGQKLVISSQIDARWLPGKDRSASVILNPTAIAYYAFTNKLSGFLEYGGFIPSQGHSQHLVQTGALYLLTPRQQLDARVAFGLNANTPHLLVGFGYSFRVDGLFGTP